jgi:anti-sigma regulatory factor (Ser/Thr protein kinase)
VTEAPARSVSLAIPPKPDYIVLARLALSAICRLTPLQPDDVADLKLAVSEVATERLTTASEEPVRLEFELEDDRLVVDVHAAAGR